jgi:hemerythrin superfamily protein
MNAIDLLKLQHRRIEKLLAKVEGTKNERSRQHVFEELADTLAAHVLIEERLFYPAIRATRTEDKLLESLEEHLALKRVLADLLTTPFADATFEAKMKVLEEQAVHHHGEEEDELFPKVGALLGEDALDALGDQMHVAFESLMVGHPSDGVPSQTQHAAAL